MHNKVFTIKINETSLRIIFTKYLLCPFYRIDLSNLSDNFPSSSGLELSP